MTGTLVLGLVATVLTGMAGSTVDAVVLAYSGVPQNVTIGGQEVEVGSIVQSVRVPVRIEKGAYVHAIAVETQSLTYELPVTVVGKRDVSWLWWLLAVPALLMLCAVRLRRGAGSS